MGAPHAAEIPYVMGNLDRVHAYAWTQDDYQVSATIQNFFANFIRTGDPNGSGLPHWLQWQAGSPEIMRIDTVSRSVEASHEPRYRLLDRLYAR